jgi:hypothetical protein
MRSRCDHFFGRYRRVAAAIATTAAITSSVHRVSRPKMTSATPLSTRAASAFRPGPRKCRRAAGFRGGSPVPMSFTSTNTDSNYVLFTLPAGRRGTRVPAAKARSSKSGNGAAQGRSAVLRGRHAVAADQLGVEQSLRPQRVAGVVVSSALAGVETGRPFPAGPVAIWLTSSGAGSFQQRSRPSAPGRDSGMRHARATCRRTDSHPGCVHLCAAAIRGGRRSRERAAPARRTQRCDLG